LKWCFQVQDCFDLSTGSGARVRPLLDPLKSGRFRIRLEHNPGIAQGEKTHDSEKMIEKITQQGKSQWQAKS
jgi:hypothetical protein